MAEKEEKGFFSTWTDLEVTTSASYYYILVWARTVRHVNIGGSDWFLGHRTGNFGKILPTRSRNTPD